MVFKKTICSILGHQPQKKSGPKRQVGYQAKSMDTGEVTGQGTVTCWLVTIYCSRCGQVFGSTVEFEGMTVPPRSEVKMDLSFAVTIPKNNPASS